MELAKKASSDFNSQSPDDADTLAAAFAENGEFGEAIKWQQKALEFLGDRKPEHANAMRDRLKLFRAGSPFRESESR